MHMVAPQPSLARADYRIAVDRDRRVMRLTLSGFYGIEDFRAFARTREDRRRELGDRPYRTLVDLRDFAIQTQDIVVHFTEHLRTSAARAERVAFVIPRSLIRQQVERAMVSRDARCFSDIGEAEAWLLAEDATAA